MNGDKKAVLIYNPTSGRGKSAKLAGRFCDLWRGKQGNSIERYMTQDRDDLQKAAVHFYTSDYLCVFLGGDGTFSDALTALAAALDYNPLRHPVGLIPGGTGNSYLRHFGTPDFQSGSAAFFNGLQFDTMVKSDLGLIEYQEDGNILTRTFLNFAGMGLVTEISVLAEKFKYLGPFSYTLAALIELLRHRPQKYQITTAMANREILADFMILANTAFVGGNMKIAPGIRSDDGRLLWLYPGIHSKMSLFSLFPRIFTGSHIGQNNVNIEYIKELNIQTPAPRRGKQEIFNAVIDGELLLLENPAISILPEYFTFYHAI